MCPLILQRKCTVTPGVIHPGITVLIMPASGLVTFGIGVAVGGAIWCEKRYSIVATRPVISAITSKFTRFLFYRYTLK